MSANQYTIMFQGVNGDITQSTGGYDDFVEYGTVSDVALKDILQKFSKIELIVINESNMDEDLCPANMSVEGNGNVYNFIPTDTGKLYCDATNSELDIDAAYDLIVGKIAKEELMPEVTQEQKDVVARMAHIRPSMPDLKASQINTASNIPQIENIVWKDKWWADTRLSMIIFAVLMLVITFIIPEEEADSAGMTLILTVILAGLAYLFGRFGKTTFTLGFDWDTNTLWAVHGKDFSWITNANQIIEFVVDKRDENLQADVATTLMTDGAITGAGKERTWVLKARKKTGRDYIVAEFAAKKEAYEVLEKAQKLLQSFS